MPLCDGLEATRRIREWEEANPHVAKHFICALTAHANKLDAEACMQVCQIIDLCHAVSVGSCLCVCVGGWGTGACTFVLMYLCADACMRIPMGHQAGMTKYMTKPLMLNELKNVLTEIGAFAPLSRV